MIEPVRPIRDDGCAGHVPGRWSPGDSAESGAGPDAPQPGRARVFCRQLFPPLAAAIFLDRRRRLFLDRRCRRRRFCSAGRDHAPMACLGPGPGAPAHACRVRLGVAECALKPLRPLRRLQVPSLRLWAGSLPPRRLRGRRAAAAACPAPPAPGSAWLAAAAGDISILLVAIFSMGIWRLDGML
jgi:hypothetical protein